MRKRDLDRWKRGRARAGVVESVSIRHLEGHPKKNAGLPEVVEHDHIHCPCTICKHKHQADCEKANCLCCSSLCT